MDGHTLRIGELSRRTGVSPELLRAWERRYGLLDPARTGGGLRLYSPDDEHRVRAMQAELERGISAAEAARLALAEPESGRGGPEGAVHVARERLTAALDAMDAEDAHAAIDEAFSTFMTETVLSGVILPYLRDLGSRWEEGAVSVAQEHFASNLIRGRLLALARGWERGGGRIALLACAAGEQHDLPLIVFGLALREHGWRIIFLGADTPAASVAETADQVRPALVVVAAVTSNGFHGEAGRLAALAKDHELAIAGSGASDEVARSLGCRVLAGDPVAAAAAL